MCQAMAVGLWQLGKPGDMVCPRSVMSSPEVHLSGKDLGFQSSPPGPQVLLGHDPQSKRAGSVAVDPLCFQIILGSWWK